MEIGKRKWKCANHWRVVLRMRKVGIATLHSSVLDHILENHGGKLFLEPELDTNQLLTLLEQLHLGFVAKFRNLYV